MIEKVSDPQLQQAGLVPDAQAVEVAQRVRGLERRHELAEGQDGDEEDGRERQAEDDRYDDRERPPEDADRHGPRGAAVVQRLAHGDDHGAHEPHESPWVVTLPLILLAIPSILIGFFTVGPMLVGTDGKRRDNSE